MPLFARSYQNAAKDELEGQIRQLEEKSKKGKEDQEFAEAFYRTEANLTFAERLQLVSTEQADEYKDRIAKAKTEAEQLRSTKENEQKNNASEGYKKQEGSCMSMEEARARIAQERAEQEAKKNQSEQSHSCPAKDGEGGKIR